ncbi:hypothetical protein AVEN_210414-1, partial [Araneus ventricosus]
MESTQFFLGSASVVPMLWMWIKILIFNEASFWITLISYVGIFSWYSLSVLISLTDGFLAETSKMDKEAQTIAHCMRDQYVQTEDFIVSAIESEEIVKNVSELEEGDNILTSETATVEVESFESEGSTTEPDSDSNTLPASSLLPEPLA